MKRVLFLKAHIPGYTRKDGVAVRPHEDARAPAADGWELVASRKDGSKDHRRLVTAGGAPKFAGSGKRYARIFELGDGEVHGTDHLGHSRRFDSVEHAKSVMGGKSAT